MMRNIQNVKDDIVEMKRLIKQILISDSDILEALNNPDIDIDSPDDFLNTNIFGFTKVPQTQDSVKNFICFTIEDVEESRYNEVMKVQYINFHVICSVDDMVTEYGIERHDLLAYLIRDNFNWTNKFGLQFKLINNSEATVNTDYYCRTLVFESTKVNHLNNARMSGAYDKLGR